MARLGIPSLCPIVLGISSLFFAMAIELSRASQLEENLKNRGKRLWWCVEAFFISFDAY